MTLASAAAKVASSASSPTSATAETPRGTGSTAPDMPTRSATTERAVAFVAAHREPAAALGRHVATLADDPDALVAALRDGLAALADLEYLAGQRHVAPGIGAIHGVRWPLLAAVGRELRAGTRGDAPATLLYVAERLYREPTLEERWLAFGLLERILPADPERAWQLLRRGAREAGDWITVDTLAHPYGRGILDEPYRWAELEQLVYSPSRWERRLVGSTIATIPHVDRRAGRDPRIAATALPIVGSLIGDAEPDVQKALAWALREQTKVDPAAVAAFCEAEAERAAADVDGHRAWVVRETLVKLEPGTAGRLRERLAGVRRRPGAPSTSTAAAAVERFTAGGGLPDPTAHPEPPLTPGDR
jgi:3-methyladenine DNA glycosylase AlkD